LGGRGRAGNKQGADVGADRGQHVAIDSVVFSGRKDEKSWATTSSTGCRAIKHFTTGFFLLLLLQLLFTSLTQVLSGKKHGGGKKKLAPKCGLSYFSVVNFKPVCACKHFQVMGSRTSGV
jgi:hypothetical protein